MTVDTATPGPPSLSRFAMFVTRGLNVLFSAILRSLLHKMLSNRFILLSFKGRKSGKIYTILVGYRCEGDVIEVITPRGWWKNLRGANTPVMVLLKGQWCHGIAEAFHGDETVATGYLRFMQRSPALIKMYHIELDTNGQPKLESVRLATQNTALVRIQLTTSE
jgi:hypothetical protein